MDAWIANLSDGSTKSEDWREGELSPWQRLMKYCKDNRCYVTNLRLTIGTKTVSCPPNAKGYWQAHGMPAVQGVSPDEDLHKTRGIGWVEGDNVRIIWGARAPQNHEPIFWHDARPAKGQGQIIWAKQDLVLPQVDTRSDAKVNGLKEFTSEILREAGGVKPVHNH